ncbi:hypothetical protein, partial [Nonomuraea sp. NPDC046570]|uniref:hypothetical protein n=1 Tax=Nonomuraea sp. NPDC046570 TaxID=3155255 RepID=UPI0033F83DB2
MHRPDLLEQPVPLMAVQLFLDPVLDPARHDRRARLPQHQADVLADAWEDDDPAHSRKRELLQDIVTALVLTPVRWAKG